MQKLATRYQHGLRYIALALPALFLLVFFFYPLGTILFRSFRTSEMPALPNLRYYVRLLWFTTWQAAASTLLTLGLGLPGAHVFARYRFRGKSLLRALTTIPFVMPTLIVATAFLSLLGPSGVVNAVLMDVFQLAEPPLNLQHTIWSILLAHVFYNYSVVLRIVGSAWSSLNPRLEEAARALGASPWTAWKEITLPQLMPSLVAAALLIFAFCFTSFGVIMVLGGPYFATIEVEIYRQTTHMLNLPLAAVLSVLQMVVTFAVMSGYAAIQRRTSRPLDYRSRLVAGRESNTWRSGSWIALNLIVMMVLLFAPLAALVWRSFTLGDGVTLRYYAALMKNLDRSLFFTPPLVAIRNSVGFATVTVFISLLLGTLGAYLLDSGRGRSRRLIAWLDPLFALPLAASAVTLGFGYLISMNRAPLNLISSPILVPVAHALLAFPFVLRSVLPALRSIQPHIREAAAVLGATPGRVLWSIDLPLIARALVVGAVFAFTISIGEFGATLIIARANYATIPVAIYRFLSQPGDLNIGRALAMSTLLMGVCTISFVLIERLGMGEAESF